MAEREAHRPVVVLLHGWPVTQKHWRHLLPALSRAGFACLPLSLPGLGTPAAVPEDFRKTSLAGWVIDAVEAAGVDRFALIGHDWGATVAAHVASLRPDSVPALVVEEEVLPGVAVELASPGADHYPSWHGPFNRVPGLGERLVPGNEAAYYGTFLMQSAGPEGLADEVMSDYVAAYSTPGVIEPSLAYYRTRTEDIADTKRLIDTPIMTPVLAMGGRFAMADAVEAGMRHIANDVIGTVSEVAGHYPAEQEPEKSARAITAFLLRHHH